MATEKYHKTMFGLSALWNWSAAILFLGLELGTQGGLSFFVKIMPERFLWFNMFCASVIIFGIGYYWASKDVYTNRNIIKMGVMGKVCVFILLLHGWITGVVTIFSLGAGTVDLIFAILFIDVLIKTKK